MEDFKKGDKLYFKSECMNWHKVTFDEYCIDDSKNCEVVFNCLNGEKNSLETVSIKFLTKTRTWKILKKNRNARGLS